MLTAFYLHLGPFSRQVIRRIEQQLEELRTAAPGPRGPISRPALPERLGDVLTVATSTGGNAYVAVAVTEAPPLQQMQGSPEAGR